MESMDKCTCVCVCVCVCACKCTDLILYLTKSPYICSIFLLLNLAKEAHSNQDTKKMCLFSLNWVHMEFPLPEEKEEELLFSFKVNKFPNESGILLLQI